MLPVKAVTAAQDTEDVTTGFLIISDVTAHDAGKYCCVASNEGVQTESDCVQLTVQSTRNLCSVLLISVHFKIAPTDTFSIVCKIHVRCGTMFYCELSTFSTSSCYQ